MRETTTRSIAVTGAAWETGRRSFGNDIWFFAPSLKQYSTSEFGQDCDCYFKPVSITGSRCELLCDHCGAEILGHMRATLTPDELLSTAVELKASGARGLLISGGSDADGVVPLAPFLEAIAEIKSRLGLKIIVHTAITDAELARGLASAGVDAAMIDVIGARETILEVCHLRDTTVFDYERSLANLVDAGVPTAPHVVIGLHRGAINGEMKALEMISRYRVASLVLVGIVPKRNTPMAGVTPPTPMEMAELFEAARCMMPETPILLGCERPWGDHKLLTDELALRAGLNGIAYPADGIIALATDMGLNPRMSQMCCALMFENLEMP